MDLSNLRFNRKLFAESAMSVATIWQRCHCCHPTVRHFFLYASPEMLYFATVSQSSGRRMLMWENKSMTEHIRLSGWKASSEKKNVGHPSPMEWARTDLIQRLHTACFRSYFGTDTAHDAAKVAWLSDLRCVKRRHEWRGHSFKKRW